jgi:hypothetical protein
MEEILASIRRIISEDDAPAPDPEVPAAVHASEPALHALEPAPHASGPEPAAAAEDDVLELTDRLDEPAPLERLGDLDLMPAGAPEPARAPEPLFSSDETIVSPPAASTAASAFGQLHRQVLMPAEGRSLEDVVRELLRPLLKGWLDEHLPGIVQSAVEAEVDRISRQRR